MVSSDYQSNQAAIRAHRLLQRGARAWYKTWKTAAALGCIILHSTLTLVSCHSTGPDYRQPLSPSSTINAPQPAFGKHQQYGSSMSGASTPTAYADNNAAVMAANNAANNYSKLREPYPAWTANIPLSKEEIEDVFIDLTNKFGFQRDSMRNMYDHFMIQLDSRASSECRVTAILGTPLTARFCLIPQE